MKILIFFSKKPIIQRFIQMGNNYNETYIILLQSGIQGMNSYGEINCASTYPRIHPNLL